MKTLHIGGPAHGRVLETEGSLTYVMDEPEWMPAADRQYVLATLPGGIEVYHPVGICYRQVKARYTRWAATPDGQAYLDAVTSPAAPGVAAGGPTDIVDPVGLPEITDDDLPSGWIPRGHDDDPQTSGSLDDA